MDRVTFKVNGVEQSVGSEVTSNVTLLEYLRQWMELRGTKYMCLEAGCGACIVSVVKSAGKLPEGVNACMVPVTSCHGWEITTIEKVGNRLDGYHPLQQSLYQNNGSQCGYCSPGWIMAMYSLLNNKKSMTMLEIEKSLGSNLCRCTGYRPIIKAFKKFAIDSPDRSNILDIEDLSICEKTGDVCKHTCDDYDWCMVEKKDVKPSTSLHIKLSDDRNWYKIDDLREVFRIFKLHSGDDYMLVCGNTAKVLNPIVEYPKLIIDISSAPLLKGYFLQQNLVVGAGNTLTEMINIFETVGKQDNFEYLLAFAEHYKSIAHIPVRNVATVAGNLMIKNKNHGFNSDPYMLFKLVGAQIGIVNESGRITEISMASFLNENMNKKILYNIVLPPLNADFTKIVTYRVMPRSQNVRAVVHSAFRYKLDATNRVQECRILFGGLAATFSEAKRTEAYLKGRNLFTNETLQGALSVLNQEMVVTQTAPEMSIAYRRKMALGLFYKGLLSICPDSTVGAKYKSGVTRLRDERTVSDGKQVYDTNPTLWPLNQPSPKFDGLVQVAGEADYTDDLPSLPHEVFAAFVLATAIGTIDNIDATEALNMPGVVAFYTAADIPGVNSYTPGGTTFYQANEEVLCDKEVKFFHQPLGIIVAETQHLAEKASRLIQVTYSNVRTPVLDIKVAKNDTSRTKLFKSIDATSKGNNVSKVIRGEMTIYGQYHFPMETLACIAHPTEEGIKLHSATQWIDGVQHMVSRVLKLQTNKVDVSLRRLGGGYGMKISRANQVAVACALVTHKLNRPCRFLQSLKHNMQYVGKRFPCSNTFQTSVNSEGVIQYNDYSLYEDNGYVVGEPVALYSSDSYNNCYDEKPWQFKLYDSTTDTPSNTFCRSPGTLETIAMAELLMERISYELGLDPLNVRLANMAEAYRADIREILDTIKKNADYEARRTAVNQFNSQNRWKKRGLRHTFLRWTPIGSVYLNILVSVYAEDGSVIVTHGGVEMGQGINTIVAQVCAHALGIPVAKVQVKPSDTTNSPNGFISGGSITTQFAGVGVTKCCNKLLENLKPIRDQNPGVTWEQLIKLAAAKEVELQVHSATGVADTRNYQIYGIALAETEIDVLTGEWNINRVDLMEDVGRSVNPEIDVGQVEGAFMMGQGYWTTEQLVFQSTGELVTDRTWHYWIPQARDIPQDLRIYFRQRSFSEDYVFGSKATGEPAACMGVVIPIAMRAAIVEARKESGLPTTTWFDIDGPMNVEQVCVACATKITDFKFY